MREIWCALLIVGVMASVAGCTTPVDNTTLETTPVPQTEMPALKETPAPLTLRPAVSADLPDFDYANVLVISPGGTDWMETNASHVARVALRDRAAREMYLGGGEVEGVFLSCHSTPFPSSGRGCAPALRITNKTASVDFLVDEGEGRVVTTVTEIRGA
ncbi:hypothetical protein E2N92_04230 [Methanofollis formosanus]|uniref:Uncharacterized protein n=1 Tax=Methanofollis formosanus TaxID=299308 RepID=A0A8G1EG11_9EURY|nr:hypothetical protein [Methanofollis formosanus]QYZ78689.1 hypothetical protein E2N92_04230 [Methanofollis formosanus]